MIHKSILLVLLLGFNLSFGQTLTAGFDKAEYIELLKAYSRWGDSVYYTGIEASAKFHPTYRSPVVGLDNRWELYVSEDDIAVISIRGTTKNPTSWLANFYAAMVPAKGSIDLSDSVRFDYELAKNPKAAVHVGWLLSTAFLSEDILQKIDACYRSGIRNFIVFGHSQGGAIAFLLTSYLKQLIEAGDLPNDMVLKTYCSAAPKPGNLFYAYEFESETAGGWSFNVVNAADWVPETPISIQTANDFNATNPFSNAKEAIKGQKFPRRLFLGHLYRQLTRHTAKAQRKYEKYLGRMTSKYVKNQYPEFDVPPYYHSNHYVRTGNTIVLMPDEAYYSMFPDDQKQVFIHHQLQAYIHLTEKLK